MLTPDCPDFEQREAARLARRERNRKRWEEDKKNVNKQLEQTREATPEVAVELDLLPDDTSLSKLRAIIASTTEPLYRRVEAAEIVLSYELAPGALVNIQADQISAASYRFMQAVADHPETPDSIRFKALRSLAGIENARARASDAETQQARRSAYIDAINRARRAELVRLGQWQHVCASAIPWSLSPSDDIDHPTPSRAHESIGAGLDRSRNLPPAELAARNAARTAQLLSVRARNRPDEWLPDPHKS